MIHRTKRRAFRPAIVVLSFLAFGLANSAVAQEDSGSDLADARRDVGPPKTLTQLLEYADQHAPALRRARSERKLGAADVVGAQKLQPFNPELESEVKFGLDGGRLAKAEVTLKQRLEVAGERGLRIEAARHRQAALEAEVARADWHIHQKVHRLYRTGTIGRQRVTLQRDTLEFTRELRDIARDRFEAGEEPKTSVVVARAEVASARQRLVRARNVYLRTLRELATAIGWEQPKPPRPGGQLAAARELPTTKQLIDRAYEEDPDLAVLEAKLEEERARLELRQREVWPNPVVGVGWEGQRSVGDQLGHGIRFVIGIPLPIWNRNQGEVAKSRARMAVIRQAIENRKDVLANQIRKQVEVVRSSYRETRIYQNEVLPAFETQLDLLQEGFELGEMSLLDVMNARDRLLAVERQYLDSLEQYYLAVSELERLLGASIWNSSEHQNEETSP